MLTASVKIASQRPYVCYGGLSVLVLLQERFGFVGFVGGDEEAYKCPCGPGSVESAHYLTVDESLSLLLFFCRSNTSIVYLCSEVR